MDQKNSEFIDANRNLDEISLKEIILKINKWWRFLLSKWITILIAGIIGGTIGLAYSVFKKPAYKAELSFALEDDKAEGGLGGALGLASQFGVDLGSGGGGAFSGDNLLELMKSRTMIEKALLNTTIVNGHPKTLIEQYIDFNKLRDNWAKNVNLKSLHFLPNADPNKFTLLQDSIVSVIYKSLADNNLLVDKLDKKLSIINIVVTTKNELFSKYFAESIAKTVSNFYIDTKVKKSVQNVNILQRQVDSVKQELNKAIAGVASSYDVNPNPNPSLLILKVPSQRRQIDVQASQAILTQLVTQLEIAKVSLRKETPLIQIIDMPVLPLVKDGVGKSKAAIIGGMIAVFLTVMWIVFSKALKNIMD